MATQVNFSDLETWLSNQPENTPETAYEIEVINIPRLTNPRTDFRNKLVGDNITKYVDLSATELTGSNVPNSGTYNNSLEYLFGDCINLVKPPVISNISTTGLKLNEMFKGCTNMVEAPALPQRIARFDYMFQGCSSMTTPPVLTNTYFDYRYVSNAFENSGITTAPVIPYGFTNLDAFFAGCTNLVYAPILPASLISISSCFDGCTALTNPPSIPSSVTDVSFAFRNCTSLSYKPIIPSGATYTDYVFDGVTQTKWADTETKLENWIPNQTSEFEVLVIEEDEDNNRYNILDRTVYGVSVSNLSEWLEDMDENTTATPYEIKVLSLTSSNINDIGTALNENETKFVDLGWTTIPSVTSMSETFDGCSSLIVSPVLPSGLASLVQVYKNCVNLSEYPSIPSSVSNLSYAFEGCSFNATPTLSNSVTNMTGTFKNCVNLEEITNFPTGLLNLSECFAGCALLEEIPTLPSTITSLSGTFKGCVGLEEAPTIPSNVTDISYTFKGCIIDEAPAIPSSVTNMNGTFKNCKNITEIELIPSSVTSAEECFMGCSSLAVIDEFRVPLATLENNEDFHNMFLGCPNLNQIGYKIDESSEWHVFRLKFGNSTVEGEIFDKSGNVTDINGGTAVSITKDTLTLPIKTDELWFPSGYQDSAIDAVIHNVLTYKYTYFNKEEVLQPNKKSFVLWAEDKDNFKTNLSLGSDIPVYPTLADLEADISNLSDGDIVAYEQGGDGVVDAVTSGDLRAVTSNAVASLKTTFTAFKREIFNFKSTVSFNGVQYALFGIQHVIGIITANQAIAQYETIATVDTNLISGNFDMIGYHDIDNTISSVIILHRSGNGLQPRSGISSGQRIRIDFSYPIS